MSTEEEAGTSEAAEVARLLFARGAVREALALLRGVVAREPDEGACAALLARIEAGDDPAAPSETQIGLALVDRWIRSGMLVEALAVLAGTPLGAHGAGGEWAGVLGELLAPVPIGCEPTIAAVHHELLSGGASVALVMLEERAAGERAMPAWATRRLELLRWLLLDNAEAAPATDLSSTPTNAIAARLREALRATALPEAALAMQRFADERPADPEARLVADALAVLAAEIARRSLDGPTQQRTAPMHGRPAAAMQVGMANFADASRIYARLRREGAGEDVARLERSAHVVLHALEGLPLGQTNAAIPVTSEHRIDGLEPRDDTESTLEMPDGAEEAERLVRAGRLREAEELYRAIAALAPEQDEWRRRADELAAQSSAESRGVLVRVIHRVD